MSDDYQARRDRSASVGHGIKLAAELAIAAGGDLKELVDNFGMIVDGLVEEVLRVQTKNELQAAFPGATTEPAAPVFVRATPDGPVAPAPQYQQAPPAPEAPPAPAPIPGAVDGDPEVAALWQRFFADPSAWNDKRGNKKQRSSPDFQHRSEKQPGTDFPLALWVEGKKNPSWVIPTLRQRGLLQ